MALNSKTRISPARLLLSWFVLLAALAALLFIPAGRLDWLQAWLFILAYGGYLLFYMVWGLRNDPGQLAERSRRGLHGKSWDRVIISVYSVLLLVMMVVTGLDGGRYRWAPVPLWLQLVGWIGLAFCSWMVFWTISTNSYASRVVRIQYDRGQRVVADGPYHYVRHPMYQGIIVMVVSLPLALGSLVALIPGMAIAALFVLRTALEDRTLQSELPGYADYAQRVPFRLVPRIW
jgi:protein-S-isoprenylcysteine O-methyltransferase Ste14